jgi:hypothetical protein
MSAADSERRVSAAYRLKHDLGKAIRWNAPRERESSPAELRARLERDLLAARDGPNGPLSAVEVFDGWMAQESGHFRRGTAAGDRLARIAAAVDFLRDRLPRLGELDSGELGEVDDAAIVVAEESRALWRDVMSESARPS